MSVPSTAVIFESPRKVKLAELELPDPGPEDVVIDNVYTGISVGTEGWILRGERPVDTSFPCVPGYQQTGVITWVGGRVSGLAVGDRVNNFNTKLPPDVGLGWGGHAGTAVTHHGSVVKIPDAVTLKSASLAKLFAVGYHGVQQTEIHSGDLVVVLGLGMIGQGYAQVARARGARVIGADTVANRIELAAAHSCDIAVHGDDLDKALREKRPDGADIVADTTGRTELIDRCVSLVRQGGKIVWQGWYPGRVSFEFHPAHGKRVKMVFPCSWEGEDVVLDMLGSGQLTIEPLISHIIDASDAPRAYQLMLNSPSEFMGIALKWREE